MYTSKKLSKWLLENGHIWETKNWWVETEEGWEIYRIITIVRDSEKTGRYIRAYDIANDLLIKHAKELFREGDLLRECSDACTSYHPLLPDKIEHWHVTGQLCTMEVLYLLQQGKQEEAEDYIMKHAIKKD